ncbi:unnamed protein product [Alopecurus aequalis]
MESRPPEIGHDEDRISALPEELLLGILERVGLRDAVRAGVASTRWRHLPHQLSRVDLDVRDFQGTTPAETMDAFAGATQRLLSTAECKCDCSSRRAVKIIRLRLYLSVSVTHLDSIGRAVEDTMSRGETDIFEFELLVHSSELIASRQPDWHAEFGHKFMSFYRACHSAFRLLTDLSLTSLEFGGSDLPSLLGACAKLKLLSLKSCRMAGYSSLMIDVPNSAIHGLKFINFGCKRIELVSVPLLREVLCLAWYSENTPVRFGYVPELRKVTLGCHSRAWQAPFKLSECFSINTRNLSKLCLNFRCQMIWIQPEHPMQLTSIFENLTDVYLTHIFPECDLSWTLFILEAAPAMRTFLLDRARHSCAETSEHSAEKANVVWEPSKDLKHPNLRLLLMSGFEEEDKVANYIRLVMERAAGLKRIELHNDTCGACDAVSLESPRRSQAGEDNSHRIKERLTSGPSSSVEIIIC